ncbi:Target of rapamycin complex 1 subunit kog1 [Coemansia sp. RSA 1843]|nr:Target of rapamycin complex 1 subunit kog1 [Coemansia sp. RSA 1843]
MASATPPAATPGEEDLNSQLADGIATITLGPAEGGGKDQAIYVTTPTGVKVDIQEILESGGATGGSRQRMGNQTVMESRKDFHTHPRSLLLANLQLADWRTHEKLHTPGALLSVCLNLGVPPPDLVAPKRSAVLEAWVDPYAEMQVPTPEELALQQNAAGNNPTHGNVGRERTPLKAIGENLMRQFQSIQRNARYKLLLDCVMEDLRKYCVQFRRAAKEERLLFYYNGHGVPRPTNSGDIWVFNKQYTQYIPISAMDLMSWIGTPGVFVWDCSNAMEIVKAFEKNAKTREVEIAKIRHAAEATGAKLPLGKVSSETLAIITSNIATLLASQAASSTSGSAPNTQAQQQQQQQASAPPINLALINLALLPQMHHEDIHFAATRSDELLPTNPELPADLFTSCLTTPVKVALRFWVTRNPHTSKVTLDMCEKLPGSVQDRRTPFGELNWIFTSITDTIAWNTLPREQFRKLFRQDVVVASLYRNFMLADRIMRFYGVHPQCSPAIPPTHKHPLWASLDLEIDMCLQQLPRLLREEERRQRREAKAKRNEEERLARMGRRDAQGKLSAGSANGQNNSHAEVRGPQEPRLEIASEFESVSGRQGSRMGLGLGRGSGSGGANGGSAGVGETDDESSDSGNDSDNPIESGVSGTDGRVTGYISSTYFSNQLYAFEVWLQHAATVVSQFVSDQGPDQQPRSLSTEPPPNLDPPDELPAVLQVLLSQQYRVRALILLYRFMNLGPWAVDLAMAVGIHPYMSKLLASTTTEIREILILVWARLSAVDMGLHAELLKGDGFQYFVSYLANNIHMQYEPVSEKVRLCDAVCAASAFTLTMLCKDMPTAQQACFGERVLDYSLVYLQRPDNGTEERARLRAWILLCLAELWKAYPDAKWMAMTYKLCVIDSKRRQQQQQQQQQHQGLGGGYDSGAQLNGDNGAASGATPSIEELLAASAEDDSVDARDAQVLLIQMAFHRSPLVRASAIYAMGTLLQDIPQLGDNHGVLVIVRKVERQIFALLLQAAVDGNPMVRREVVHVIGSAVFASYFPQAIEAVGRVVGEEMRDYPKPSQTQSQTQQQQQQQRRAGPTMRSGQQQQQQQQSQQSGSGGSNSLGDRELGESFELPMDLMVRLYKTLLNLSMDSHIDVAQPAREACDVLMQCYAHSRMFFNVEAALDKSLHRMEITRAASGQRPIMGFIRGSSSIGDALLGQPPANSQDDVAIASQVRTIDPRGGSLNVGRGSQQGQSEQLQQQQQQRRLSGYSGKRSSGSGVLPTAVAEQRGRDIGSGGGAGRQNSVPAHHRYTMHFMQSDTSSSASQGIFGSERGRQTTQSPSSAIASGSLSTFSNMTGSPPPPPPPMVLSPTQSKDRFSGLDDVDRRIVAIEEAWLEWGRRELRETVCVSTLIDWAGAHFTEFDIALFASFSGPMQGSAALVESRERSRRIERLEASARTMGGSVGHMKWLDVTTVASGAAAATTAIMHPVEPHAIVASHRGTVSVYDWEMQAQVGQFSIATTRGGTEASTAISSMHLINPLGQAKLLVATRDGGVRIFASHAPDFQPPPAGSQQTPVFPRPRLLTAFTAVPWTATAAAAVVASANGAAAIAAAATPAATPATYASGSGGSGRGPATLNRSLTTIDGNPRMRALHKSQLPSGRNDILAGMTAAASGSKVRYGIEGASSSGLVTAWNQRNALLYAGGNDKEVRVWDINAEMCIEEIPVASIGGINCISQDGVSGNIFATGNVDGVVRVMDRRLKARTGVVANWREHSPFAVRNVFMRPGHTEVISAATNGDIKYWDLRHPSSVYTVVETHADNALGHMAVHENAPVTLTASADSAKIWNQRGNNIGVVTAAKNTYGSIASYMKSLAGYGAKAPAVQLTAAAMHMYLPVALIVSDDGRVSYIQPMKPNGSGASGGIDGSGRSGHGVASLAGARAASVL